MDNSKAQRTHKQDKKQVEELIRSAMQDFLVRKSGLNLEKTKNLQNLVSQISEYLSAFIIIGYDVSGESVNLVHATNQMDADALSAAINKFLIHSTSNTPEGK
jgi:4-hydroxy-3-methylbut-2-enyl diphosphate reductase IspH